MKNITHKKSRVPQGIKIEGVYTFTFRNILTGAERVVEYKNLIPTVGRQAIASYLTSSTPTPATLRCTHTALGTGTNAPANADTQLQTETFRKAVASATNSANVAYVSAFYTAAEAVGTHREAGIFIDGTGVANSGTLFSRVAINITKSAIETLTIDYQVTIS